MRLNFILICIICICFYTVLNAQVIKSIHQEDSESHAASGLTLRDYYLMNTANALPKSIVQSNCTLNKIVFGWHPYWNNGLENNYNWNLISDLSYFAYEVNPANGQASSTRGWDTVAVVDSALAHGVRVNLCVTLFSNHASFFSSSAAQQTLISNLITKVQQRNAHGVNIDFEAVPSANKNDLTAFMINLCNQMHAAIPGSKVSMALPSVDWSGTYDVAAMINHVDLFLIMGYDYYYSGSAQAGPTDPLYTHISTYNYNISKSVNYYLDKGVPEARLALGLPYYGREWPTASSSVPSNTTGTGVSRTYKYVRSNTGGNYANGSSYNKSMSTHHVFHDGVSWRQCFITDAYMMGRKYDLVLQRNLAGIGIWALGNDDGYNDLWNVIQNKFTNCATTVCSDTLYDMGGPEGNYYSNENYSFTITPTGASGLNLTFSNFNITSPADTLKIFNGNSVNAPLIGSYTGTQSPGSINANGNSLTLKFKSGTSSSASGWNAIWTCSGDTTPPTTTITTNNIWVNNDFTATFNDTDNLGGSGVARRFYMVSDFNGNTWDNNSHRGFLADNFNVLNPQKWISPSGTGTWAAANGILTQSNETLSNTNIYAAVNQTQSNRYLYHFNARISGNDPNKRFGFHFFADSAQYSNRLNSYFVWFRQASSELEFYKVSNDVFSLIHSQQGIVTNPGQWYDFKIIYDRITGEIHVYRNNFLISSYSDPSPYATNGNYISFRSGNCQLDVDSINVLRTRTSTQLVTVGNNTAKDIRYESLDMLTPAARINSLVTDSAFNISLPATAHIFVDYTAPDTINWVNDGIGTDIDTVTTPGVLSANWATSFDANTGVIAYEYAIGTTPGDTNVLSWTSNGLTTAVTHAGLNLIHDTTYYFAVRAINGAGFKSVVSVSNGQTAYLPGNVAALFMASSDSICSGSQVVFTNFSTNATSYEWHFQGGTPPGSTAQHPTTTYNVPGVYQVQLIVHGTSTSDTLTLPAYIHVFQNTTASFSSPDTVFLPNAIAAFQNTSDNALNYLWHFGDGHTSTDMNPWHVYDTVGIYVVSLLSFNLACVDSISKTLTVTYPASINEKSANYDINIFPNPFTDLAYMSINSLKQGVLSYTLTDITGRIITETQIMIQNYGFQVIEIPDRQTFLSQGVYFIHLRLHEEIVKYKLIKL